LAAVCTGFDWPYAEFWLAERDTDTLTLIARHPGEAPGEPEPDIVTRKAWQTGKPAWATDLTNDTEATPPARTNLAIPATSGARVLAVLSFAATAADSSTDSLIGLLSGIGAHVAEFLERRRAEDLTVELAR
ncbi:GAF domain-containing protein, partial [Actinoplanes regularis]|uniref:GAF domain-containing protein n=1 Tax=Actinoplanes regularis TaxID=52697 RepID=UPI002554D2F0